MEPMPLNVQIEGALGLDAGFVSQPQRPVGVSQRVSNRRLGVRLIREIIPRPIRRAIEHLQQVRVAPEALSARGKQRVLQIIVYHLRRVALQTGLA